MQAYYADDFEAALEIAENASADFPEKAEHTLIWQISLLSKLERTAESLQLLAASLEEGFWWPKDFFEDEDLDAVRELPEFQGLVEASHGRQLLAMEKEASPQRFVVEPVNGSEKPYPVLLTLHGRGHNGQDELDFWQETSQLGWLVVSLQSSQIFTMTGYSWDDLEKAEGEVLEHFEAICQEYEIDRQRVVLGGYSQGSGMAIYLSFHEKIAAAGFIGIGTWAPEVEPIAERALQNKSTRGYFIVGEKDHTLERADEICAVLTEAGLELGEERYPDLGHEFPPDYKKSLRQALEFIIEE
jgi:predicted esterase